MTTQATPIVDKNGKNTTVHKKVDNGSTSKRSANVAPKAAVAQEFLSTSELEIATKALVYPSDVRNKDERIRLRNEYNFATRDLEKQWQGWLADEYASEIPESAHAAIFQQAWSDGHSSGYNQVEHHYAEIADVLTAVAKAAANPASKAPKFAKKDLLDSSEVSAKVQALPYPTSKDRDENYKLRMEHRAATQQLENKWENWLADEYASQVPVESHSDLFTYAWGEGHSSGYNDVENHYMDIAHLATVVTEAVRAKK